MGVGRPPVPQRGNLDLKIFLIYEMSLSRRDKILVVPGFNPGIK
jgi:hypothetical protein